MFNFNIVYITDKPRNNTPISIKDIDLEGNTKEASNMIFNALKKLSKKVYYYDSLTDFTQNIKKHKNDLVFSTYYGTTNSNSKALVPAICEANGIKYVGANSYAHMLCNDKYLSKKYALDYGINSAADIIIRNPNNECELELLSTLNFPVIIKPNCGGGSSGISKDNIKYNIQECIKFIKELYTFCNCPILVEELIPGFEVELIVVGNKKEILLAHEVQLIIENKEYFEDIIWGFETKKIDDTNVNFKNSNYITNENKEKLCKLFQSFEKIEYMRIDCRVDLYGNLKIIELSPDCYLGNDCAFYHAFNSKKYSFDEMINTLIINCIRSYQVH